MRQRNQTKKFKKPSLGDMYLDAISKGDTEFVEQYLDGGNDALYRDCLGRTGLHVAAAHNQQAIVNLILPYFTAKDINIRNSFGRPASELNNRIGKTIQEHYKRMFKRTYKHKPYSFARNSLNLIRKQTRRASPQQQQQGNPVIYPNETSIKSFQNLYYSPLFNQPPRAPYVPTYNNKNTKRITVVNTKRRK